jgi:hypothetical protein
MTGSTIAKFLATPILALSVIVASMSASTQPAEAGIKKKLVVAAAVVGTAFIAGALIGRASRHHHH